MYKQLCAAVGQSNVFFDRYKLIASGEWQRELFSADADADALVAVVSSGWITSAWCQQEFAVAVEQGVAVIPLYLRAVASFDQQPVARFQAVPGGPMVKRPR